MKNLFLILTCLLCWTTASMADEKTDVTAQYVANASFENDNLSGLQTKTEQADGLRGYVVSSPQGWTVTNGANAVSLIVTANCYTDNNFGLVTTWPMAPRHTTCDRDGVGEPLRCARP